MKLIIAGSRTISQRDAMLAITENVEDIDSITEVVSGGALGPDLAGESWAKFIGIPVRRFLPDWRRFGKRAGIARNIEMGKYADKLLAIYDGKSRGTKQMIDWMRMYGKPVKVVIR